MLQRKEKKKGWRNNGYINVEKRCVWKKIGKKLHAGFYPRINSLQRDKSVNTSNHEQPAYVNRENCSYACLNEDHEIHVVEITRTFLSRG